ncbi:PEP-CTERM sorting domain-containing protein [Phormidesmis priestleyi ULC007]|uniref:PEP-CTERM sorting domain-containing protein n=1 Tax=Phormidesmis priestleyi ULC007 TaxID=1920490 RepID=A0A2T1DIA1_9CYAN|nr:NF038130 family PEP-CTERM protein [Phormidesmis priestleyi]PSB20161.1 PEP-CTERM sorting domain-containing protein [Phormidesmis priestleyi ULC007]PZO49091.1 MAG: PEP-CTERM sorting domain-containing protein [Phormidesmis priestleyi]
MAKKLSRFAITSAIVTASAIMGTPAFAGTLSGATIGGTQPTDYLIYDANNTNTFEVAKTPANLAKVLGGNSTSPTGNVELAASSEKPGFNFTKNTSLTGTIGGKAITISSLTKDDWNSAYNGTTFGQSWFNQAMTQNGFGSLAGTSDGVQVFNIFKTYGGFERFSDPNISYLNQNDTTGEIQVGLAGHLNANSLITKSLDAYLAGLTGNSAATQQSKVKITGLKNQLGASTIQASEVFKYTYNGVTDYGYGFSATKSNLVEKSDGISHSGNYEIKIKGVAPPKHVPEPSTLMGLVGLGSLLAFKRRLLRKA